MAATTIRADGSRHGRNSVRPGSWIGLVLCVGVMFAWVVQQLLPDQQDDGPRWAPDWLPVVAVAFAGAALMAPRDSPHARRAWQAAGWTGLLLMVWSANGLPFDLLTMAGLIGHRTASGAIVMSSVYWPGLATRAFALAAAVVLARHVLSRTSAPASTRPATWYGYAAFLLALPYPLLRLHWALGGTLGIVAPGAAGEGWEPLLIAIPWALAAALSLLLVSPPRWMPRRLLLAAGWSGTIIVAMIGPAALWTFVSTLAAGGDTGSADIELWVFGLFYGSWFLWAIAAGAATRSYGSRSTASQGSRAT